MIRQLVAGIRHVQFRRLVRGAQGTLGTQGAPGSMICAARRRNVLDSCRSGSVSLRSVSTLSVQLLRLFAGFPTPRVFGPLPLLNLC